MEKAKEMVQPAKEQIREFDLKARLTMFCNYKIKKQAAIKKEKLAAAGNTKMTELIAAFIKQKPLTIQYALMLHIVFAREFEEIRRRIKSEQLTLAHLSVESYWHGGGRRIGVAEAIFFSYTFHSEAFPDGELIISEILESLNQDPSLEILNLISQKIEALS